MGGEQISESEHLSEDERRAVAVLAAAAAAADGIEPLGEQELLGLSEPGVRHLRAGLGTAVTGYAQVDPAHGSVALVVHPDRRGQGTGRRLARAALAAAPGTRCWAHGTLPGAVALAESLGLAVSRQLHHMVVDLPATLPDPRLPGARLPDGVVLRPFRPGSDEAEWLELNTRAFVDLPDQGGWTARDLALRQSQPWFDPAGFLLAVDRSGAMVGFHWTKVEQQAGEVYVVGVDPSLRGEGLGRSLTLAGLHHLHAAGVRAVTLYVDAANTPALTLYRSLGFRIDRTDTEFLHQPS